MSDRKVVYLAHPLSGTYAEMQRNRENGAQWCAWLCRHFHVATVADWIVMSSVLLETPENRALGLDCDKALVERCDGVILASNRISGGMAIERDHSVLVGRWVADLTPLGIVVPNEKTSVEAVAAKLEGFGIRRAA